MRNFFTTLKAALLILSVIFNGYAIAQCVTPVITTIGNSGPACPGGTVTLNADGTVNGVSSSFIRVAGIGGNQGNREMDEVFASGDRAGSMVRISNTQFNSIFAAQSTNAAKAAAIKAQYDVLLFTWASAQNTALNWGLIDAFLALGGGVFWEDDQNIHRLNDGTSNSVVGEGFNGSYGCTYQIVMPAPFPALVANGVNGCFSNHHLKVNSFPSWMKTYIKGAAGEHLAVAGIHPTGGGRLIVQGPDQDFHAVHGAPHGSTGHNQYQILLNQMDFLAAEQTGISWTGPNGFTSNEKSPILTNVTAAQSGVYTAKLTNVTGGGCFVTATTTVEIKSADVPTVTASGTTDLCPGNTVTLTSSAGTSYLWNNGSTAPSITVSSAGNYTVKTTGSNGCAATSATVNVNVNTSFCNRAPVAVCNPIVMNAVGGCSASASAADFDGGSTDADGDVMTFTISPAGPYPVGTTNVTLTVTDPAGASSSCTTTITVLDVTAPVISCPFNITINADPGQCGAVVTYSQPSATDNCGNGSLPTVLAGHTYMGTFGGHTYFLSNTATNPETAHANAIAAGGHLVTISSEAENAFVSAMNPGFIWIGFTDRAVEGAYKWVTSEPVSFTKWNSGEPNNYLGNEDWAVINWGPNGTWNDWFYTSTALYVIEFEGGNIPTTQASGLGSGSLFPIGTTTETWQAIDASGNMATCSFTVTVIDNQPPVPTVANLPAINAECAVTVTAPTATDNCGTITATTTNPTTFTSQGTYAINWKYDDGNGHVVNQVQTVIVKDVTAPVVSCPSPISVNNDAGKCGAYVAVPAPVISDNCNVVCNTEGLDEYTTGIASGKSPQWGVWPGGASSLVSTERYFSAPNSLKVTGHPNGGPADQIFRLGNQTSGNWILSFRIYVPGGNTAYYNLQHTESLNSWAHEMKFHSNGTGVLRTNTGNTTFTYPQDQWIEVKQLIDQNNDQASMYVNGVFIKSWQFSTHAGNAALNNQLGAFNFFPVSNSNFIGSPEPNPAATPLYYIDDITLCGDATQIGTYVSRRYSKEYNVGTTPVAITIADLAGNKTVCSSFNVTVNDAELPTITSPAAVTVNADNGSCSATGVALGTPVTADNCDVASVTNDGPASYPVGSTTVTWTVTDVHGNVSTSTQKVSVVDNQNPILTCTTNQFFCYSGTQYSIGTLGATDNCGIASVTYEITGATQRSGSGNNASGTFNVGSSTITWTVTDVNGNTSSCSSTVTINPPVSVAIPDASSYAAGVQPNTVYVGYAPAESITYSAQPTGGTAPYTYSWSTGAASQTITVSPASVGVHNYTVTITDAKGCTATFTKSVTVVDVRCGNKNDKVLVCHKTGSAKNPYVQICVSANAVATHLANGSYLGACTNDAVTRTSKPVSEATARVLMAYPNPSQGNFNLQLKGFSKGKVTVQVLNSLGKTVLVKELNISYATQDEDLDLKGVAAGLYQVRVVNAEGVVTTAVVIAR